MSGIMMSTFMTYGTVAPVGYPIWRANSTYVSATGSVTMTFPSGYQANDILIFAIESSNIGSNMNGIPAVNKGYMVSNGWAQVASSNTVLKAPTVAVSQNTMLDIWWQRASTSSQTAVVLGDAGNHVLCVMAAIRNANTSGNPWEGTINVTQTTASSQVTSGNVTTSNANSLIVTIVSSPRDAAAARINASPLLINNSDGVELTERCDWGSTAGDGGTIAFLTHRQPTAGATANVRANTVTSNVAIIWTGALSANIP